ncbi:Baeyer-Villiger monooxygenase [Baekduia alba]|uniref:flavin-containing monooxygenase n=1 Tax=Baekduia alba TaxID=2997333 RepID=UPI002340FEF5|nr:NAD(P)/FAD-dependent oxidoreductase [Baekduia alba]WCB95082.1 Baeyer-Villiger monooxygenase [Baekduia alba]
MSPEHVDVLIVGAGVSGIGCAYHLQAEQPTKSYMILEAREATGGTWDLFKYPGIRSDSDLHTFGYAFKPWRDEKAIADGPAILDYIRETATENGIDRHIRTGHRVAGAEWSSADARWTVAVERADGTALTVTCAWLFSAGGYYRYDGGFLPDFPGLEDFAGEVIHPQQWPEDLDYAGKRVVVIGSGATAMTIVPAMAREAGHVTMLQRSPTYVISVPEKDPIANWLNRRLPADRAYALTRRKNIWLQKTIYGLSQKRPKLVRRLLRSGVKKALPEGYDVDTHFNPKYGPWDQRMCAVPDGDLFGVLSDGSASIVTDRIARFTPGGIALESGATLEADIVISATGLNLLAFGGIGLRVDGRAVDLAETLVFKGMMLSDVPNFAFAIGYTNASWTLKVDLVCEAFGRVLAFMDRTGADTCMPHPAQPGMETRPLLDFAAGYVQRAVQDFPRQGDRAPWKMPMSYAADVKTLRDGPVNDPELLFARRAGVAAPEPEPAIAA